MNWILPAYLTCLAVTGGLLVILYDLGEESPWSLRILLYLVVIGYVAGLLALYNQNPTIRTHADALVFTGVGVLILAVVLYLVLHPYHYQVLVVRLSGGAALVTILLLIVGSCSDNRKQPIPPAGSVQVTAIVHRH